MQYVLVNSKESNDVRLFAGTVQHTLDDNHRVTVPARWRFEGLSELFAVPDPRQPFLILLPDSELKKIVNDLEAAEDVEPLVRRKFVRQLFSRATPCPLDRQGRLVLPYEICSGLGLRGEVMLAGGGSRIEVWRPENWYENQTKEENSFANTADRVGL
jgi:MraZ protein